MDIVQIVSWIENFWKAEDRAPTAREVERQWGCGSDYAHAALKEWNEIGA